MMSPQSNTAASPADLLYNHLEEAVSVYEQLLPLLEEEVAIVEREDVAALDQNLKAQQALLYQVRHFDEEVDSLQKAMGIRATSLSDMAVHLPKSEGLRFFDLLGRFEQTMEAITFYRNQCTRLLSARLRQIQNATGTAAEEEAHVRYREDARGEGMPSGGSYEKTV